MTKLKRNGRKPSSLVTNLEPWQDPNVKPYIRLDNVSKSFGGVKVIHNVSLDIYQGELCALLGGSGCGKSTLLRLLAGFETPSSGKIYIDGEDMAKIPPYERPVNMMFQSYALFPHMSVEKNVAFGLRMDRVSRAEIAERVEDALELVQMRKYAKRKPHQLSGGQRQRVALARSLVKEPKLLLLDEPLGALDRKLLEKTQFELVNIQEKVGVTFVMVTHDQEEAMTMSTRIGIMEEGRISQVGNPTEVYEFPHTRSVASFIGAMNIFEGMVRVEAEDHVILQSEEMGSDLYVKHAGGLPKGAQAAVAVRPEKVLLSATPPDVAYNYFRGVVEDIAYLGDVSIYHVRLASGALAKAMQPNTQRLSEMDITWEDEVYLYWRPENGVILND